MALFTDPKSVADELSPHLDIQGTDEAAVKQIVADALKSHRKTIDIIIPGVPKVDIGKTHRLFPDVAAASVGGNTCLLAGGAGTGKTEAAFALGALLQCPTIIVPRIGDASEVIGYNDSKGNFVDTADIHAAFKRDEKFVILFDELDQSEPEQCGSIHSWFTIERE